MVRIDEHVRVLEADLEAASAIACVADDLQQANLRWRRHVCDNVISLSPEGLDKRSGMQDPGIPELP